MKTTALILAQFILANGDRATNGQSDRFPRLPSTDRLIVDPEFRSTTMGNRPHDYLHDCPHY
ncbi:MAG TPA: hypothetical protein V6D20_11890 [Candidatus Obscuribacterales bacterium]